MMDQGRVGFIGGGQMARALIGGALEARFLSPQQIIVVETCSAQQAQLKQLFTDLGVQSVATGAGDCSRIILAVKPQVLREIGGSLADQLPGDRLWISIAAGVNLAELSQMLGTQRVIRVMPNTPAQVGAGAAGVTCGRDATKDDLEWVSKLMDSVGTSAQVAESLMHAVTGVAGSSPAYVYMIIEALSDAGVAGGLQRQIATSLAAQAVLGAAKMVLETGLHPGQLKDQVTSPAGTTIEAVRVLERAGLRSAMMEAVAACIRRSQQLERPEGP
jgi:pyrroline-5-carboxylate reductase